MWNLKYENTVSNLLRDTTMIEGSWKTYLKVRKDAEKTAYSIVTW